MYRYNHHIWQNQDLQPLEKLLMLYLLDRSNEHGICWPSVTTISKDTGLARRTVMKLLRGLERRGYLTRERIGYTNTYRLNLTKIALVSGPEGDGAPDALTSAPHAPYGAPDAPGSARGAPDGASGAPGVVHEVHQIVHVVHPNQTNNHPYRTTHISTPPYNPPPELEAGRGREGEDKVEPEEEAPKPSHPGIESSEQKLESSAAACEGAHENPFASFGDLAPLVEAMVRAAPGRAHQILERGRLLLTLHGPDTFKDLWEWARKNATYSPVGAFLRYADPGVPLPQELRDRLKEAPASSPPPAPAREEAPEWLAPLARERGLEVARWWEGVARRISLAERELPPGMVSPVRRWDQPRHEAVAAVLDRAMSAARKWATGAIADALASDDPAQRLEALRAFVLGLVPPEASWDWGTLEARYVRRESPAPASRRPSEVNHAR